MNSRNKILSQLLFLIEVYDLDIINIYFRDINSIMEEVEIIFKNEHNNYIINYSYEKDNMYDVNSFGCYIKIKIGELL